MLSPFAVAHVDDMLDEVARHGGGGVFGVQLLQDLSFCGTVDDGQVTSLAGTRAKGAVPGLRLGMELVAAASAAV